jgi:uncharacterized protein (TIGR02145 family)
MRKIGMAWKLVVLIPFFCLWACKEKENEDPTVKITAPKDKAVLMRGDTVPIKALADDADGTITEVKIYIDGEEVASSALSTFIYFWNTANYEPGDYVLGALATDDQGAYDDANIDVFLGSEGGLNPDLEYGTMSDIDGNVYATIEIGSQIWMAENLKVTHYADGTPIPEITDEADWNAMVPETQAFCWYNNQIEYRDTSGALYTWAAAMNGGQSSDSIGVQGVCPDGWHLPADAEWKILELTLGMSQSDADGFDWRGTDEGGQLKEEGFSNWEMPNEGASNSSGFTAVPGGFRSVKGLFYEIDAYAAYWSTTAEEGTVNAWYRTLNNDQQKVYRQRNSKQMGLSVRCVKDQ